MNNRKSEPMSRRKFIQHVGPVVVGLPVILQITACSGGDPASGAGPDNSTNFTAGNQDNSGHAHIFTIECTDLTSGMGKTYTAALSGHTHPVTPSAGQLNTINNGGTVTINTTDQHPHTWIISKPSGACA